MSTHLAGIAPSTDKGIWNVFCVGCSDDEQNYVFPCKVVDEFAQLEPLFPTTGQLIDPEALRGEIINIINELSDDDVEVIKVKGDVT